jgi:hypothetical protein
MTARRLFASIALAALPVRGADPDLVAAVAVVSGLYKTHFAKSQRWDITLEAERRRFAAPLLKQLDEDLAAQEATPGEVVGLDFDPLTYSQEEAESYRVGAPRLEKGEALVPVEIQVGASRSALTFRLIAVEGRWRISNIHSKDGDLSATLKKLKAER